MVSLFYIVFFRDGDRLFISLLPACAGDAGFPPVWYPPGVRDLPSLMDRFIGSRRTPGCQRR